MRRQEVFFILSENFKWHNKNKSRFNKLLSQSADVSAGNGGMKN